VRSKTPIAKNPADGVLLFHGWKGLMRLKIVINKREFGWMIDARNGGWTKAPLTVTVTEFDT